MRPGIISALLLAATLGVVAKPSPDALVEAAFADDMPAVQALLKEGAVASRPNARGVSALGMACQNGNSKLVQILLENGADAKSSSGGEPVILIAARTGNSECLRLLLKHGADHNATGRRKQSALMWAAAAGHREAVTILLDAGADPAPTLNSGFDALMFAVRAGHAGVVTALIKHGSDANKAYTPDRPGGRNMRANTSPLILAIENGHLELALRLVELGADPNDQRTGFAPLHVITWVRKSVRGDGPDGIPPPQLTGHVGTLNFVRRMVTTKYADVNVRCKNGRGGAARLNTKGATPFLLAAHSADLPLLRLLLELGADPGITNADNCTALLAAAGMGVTAPGEEQAREEESLEAVKFLLKLGADINHVDKKGETVMHAAAYKSSPLLIRFLDEQGADIKIWNTKNLHGWTPLLIAQGFRPGNFRPIQYTEDALSEVMRQHGVTPPPSPPPPNPGN